MGLGRSEFIGGSYSLIPTFGANHGFSFDVDRKDNKMENWDLFSEGGVGFGFKVYKKFDVQITFDYITGLMNFNRNEDYPSVSHDPIPFYSLDEYEINSNYESYVFKTNLYGGNITIMYNF